MSNDNYNNNFTTAKVSPPPLSPTSTIPINSMQSSSSPKSKSTVIDLEKNDTFNREEIVDVHYPDKYEEAIATNSNRSISGRFDGLIALGRQFRRNVNTIEGSLFFLFSMLLFLLTHCL